jgi:hypothetical protein
MDVYCVTCGEPWENETLHEWAEMTTTTYAKVANTFQRKGCKTFAGWMYGDQSHCVPDTKSAQRSLLADLLGDDLDGMSAMLEDLEYLGMLD